MKFRKAALYTAAAVMCILILLTGCGFSGSRSGGKADESAAGNAKEPESPAEAEIRMVVETMLSKMVQGDFEEAESSFGEALSQDDYWHSFYRIGNLYASYGIPENDVGDEVKEKVKKLEESFQSRLIEEFELKAVSEDNGLGFVRAKIKYGFDLDGFAKFDAGSVLTDEAVRKTYEENKEAINAGATVEEQGTNLYTALFPAVLDAMDNYLAQADQMEGEWLISLYNDGAAWKVKGISME